MTYIVKLINFNSTRKYKNKMGKPWGTKAKNFVRELGKRLVYIVYNSLFSPKNLNTLK